jgi:hypothetical protein
MDTQPAEVTSVDFMRIATEFTQILRPDNPVPVCCFSPLSTPFFISAMSVPGVPFSLSLPLFALGRYEFGRVSILGSYDFLFNASENRPSDLVFVENLLRWVGSPSPTTRTIVLYRFPPAVSSRLAAAMHGFGFGFEVIESGPIDFDRFIALFLYSDCSADSDFADFLSVGGAIVLWIW